mgnify:CR=1 FL=1
MVAALGIVFGLLSGSYAIVFDGIYSLADGFYVAIGDFAYQVRYVGELKSWVVIDPNAPFSFYRNVPIGLNDEGVWQPLEQGLKGGAPRFRLKLWGQAQVPAPGPERVPTPYEVDKALQPELLKASNGGEESNLSGRTFSPNNPAREQAFQDHIAYVATFAMPVLIEKCSAADPTYLQRAAPAYLTKL